MSAESAWRISTGTGSTTSSWRTGSTNKVRVFFQTPAGEFEELDPALEPSFVNFPTAIRIADVDGDGRPDIVLMLQYMTVSETKERGVSGSSGICPPSDHMGRKHNFRRTP